MNQILIVFLLAFSLSSALTQDSASKPDKKKKAPAQPFSWVSPAPANKIKELKNVTHGTFQSTSMPGVEVGFYIYLPDGYANPENAEKRYPVVYFLHGGRPGGEGKNVSLAKFVHEAISAGDIEPMIYVWPNGGPMSWYNYPEKANGLGEDVFINETIPHIDKTYRTFATREKRGIEGFSQGGRGTTRIMFKHPELFGSAAPGGSGYEPEKRIQENDGVESENVKFAKGYNAWDLAKDYADKKDAPKLKPLIWVGTKGFNYEYNLKFMEYLDELGIPYEKLISPGSPHSATVIYEKKGTDLMQYHDRNFRK